MPASTLIVAAALIYVGTSLPAYSFDFFGFNLFGKKTEKEEVVEPVPDPVQYDVTLTVDDADLKERMDGVSILVTDKDKPPSGTIGLLTRARNDKRRLIAALYASAYYGGTVNVLINGRPFELIPIDTVVNRGGIAHVQIHIQTGPVFTFDKPQARTTSGTAIDLSDFGIVAGEPARSELVVEAGRKLVSAWRDKGYAFARVVDREMTADHKGDDLEVTVVLDTGPRATFGAVTIVGAKNVDADFIKKQADIPAGAIYNPKRLTDASKNLRGLGVFDSVVIVEAEKPGPDGSVAISIEVSERKPRTLGVGVTAATEDGLGAEAFWTHRNLFGRAESLKLEGAVSGIGRSTFSTSLDYNVAATFRKPGFLGPTTTFVARAEAEFQDTDAFNKKSVGGSVGLIKEFSDQMSGKISLDAEYARFTDTVGPPKTLIISAPMELTRDTRDNTAFPTSGYRMLLTAEPAYDIHNGNAFFKTMAAFSAYQAIDKSGDFVLAGRLAAGSILGSNLSQVPADRRFYAGGGGSIRGYAFQAAGPRSGTQPTGGLSLVEATLEARYKLTRSFGLAAFVDSGGAFTSSTPGKGGTWFTGVGAGIRYLTPVGALRLDVGIPLKKIEGERDFGIYLGLGQAF